VQLYDLVRKADVPRQKMMEATRGVIMAKKQDGIPMLIELLRSKDQDLHGLGLRVSRELPGPAVTKELIAEMRHSNEARQYLLVLALSDRGDESAFPVFMEMARGGFDNTRLAAISALEKSGKVAAVPALLEAAATGSPAVSQAALNSLARLGGDEVDADLRDRLPKTSGKTKRALIQVAGLRYISGTLPEIAASLEDSDPAVRTAAVSTLGAIGEEKQVAQLIQLLGKSGVDRSEVESALLAISGRKGSGCMPELIALSKNPDPALRVIGLHALASAGGKEALAALRAATEDKDETVQDEAVRTLSSWPNTWPEDEAVAEPLLALAKSARKTSYQVLAIRGYLQFLQGDKQLKGDEKVERVNQVLPAVKRPEEMRLVIGALGQIPCASGFALLQKLAADSAVSDDAYSALVSAAARNAPGVSKEDRRKALQTVVDKSANDATKKRAEEALKKVQ
jgi:HEAT repeat protein